ncbi:hypothetical protein HMPREF3159_16170 [Brachybacterium sp. HMSC06H03]|uniref:putative quinol monooxygenase n=1 Tax=Brachybacterium sp. HMSC06H03 TaxID=1581127 RepID=UPI0008A621CC|nr:putative quinol monooxygenase [Brachybacterium sp. HMSC06H03]OFT44046.1 hypothetical protein HMPREF3159_16170 [Brachybacterium sp. HMSC06H03]
MGGISPAGTRGEGRTGIVEVAGRLVCGDLDEAAAVRRHLAEQVALIRAEPGCLRFEVEPTEDPLVWTVSELFVDRAAFEVHQVSAAAASACGCTAPRRSHRSAPR